MKFYNNVNAMWLDGCSLCECDDEWMCPTETWCDDSED